MLTILIWAQVVAYFVLGLSVYLHGKNKQLNRSFFLLSSIISLWVIFNFYGGNLDNIDLSVALIRLDYIFGLLLIWALWLFCLMHHATVIANFRVSRTRILIVTGYTIFVALLILSGKFIINISSNEGTTEIQEGPAFIVMYLIPALLIISGSVLNLWLTYKNAPNNKKGRAATVLYSLIIPTLFIAVPFLILDSLIADVSGLRPIQQLSNLFLFVFIAGTTYAIIKQKLFDVRRFFAKLVAYLLLLLFIATTYVSIIVFLALNVFGEDEIPTVQLVVNVALGLMVALSYQPIKKYIDNTTRKIFFRDSYEPQAVLDKLSSLLATEIDLNPIIQASSQLIMDSLKPSYVRFLVFKDGSTFADYQIGKQPKKNVNRHDLDEFKSVLLLRDESKGKPHSLLRHYDADVLLKLRTNEETVGALLLGPKQSGTVYSKQDIDLLSISEKELAIAVQNSRYFEQIHEFNITLQQEIKEATAELRNSNVKLKELDEAKDEFISMASHQLRTPLTSVKGYISMVLEGDAGKVGPDQEKFLREAFASSQRMEYLIADLLNISRLKTGKFIIQKSEVYLPDVIEQEIKQIKPTATSRKLKIKYDKPKRFPKLQLDETKTRQVIMNFIDNAIYYTRGGGDINVILTAKKDHIEYKVVDNGIGVPKPDQAKLFNKFFRAGNARKARPDGTGLGLYMAQRVIAAQGGSIIFQSEEGKGSTFGFKFPTK